MNKNYKQLERLFIPSVAVVSMTMFWSDIIMLRFTAIMWFISTYVAYLYITFFMKESEAEK